MDMSVRIVGICRATTLSQRAGHGVRTPIRLIAVGARQLVTCGVPVVGWRIRWVGTQQSRPQLPRAQCFGARGCSPGSAQCEGCVDLVGQSSIQPREPRPGLTAGGSGYPCPVAATTSSLAVAAVGLGPGTANMLSARVIQAAVSRVGAVSR
jgi:hypothetical protein